MSDDFQGDDLDAQFLEMMQGMTPLPKKSARSLVLSPVDAPAALRAALDLVGSPAPVVALGRNSAVYMDIEAGGAESEAEEMMALLGEERPQPKEADQMARLLSKMSPLGAVALTAWTTEDPAGEGEPQVTGTIIARRYVNGEPEASLSSGLVLAGLELAAEELLLGRITPEQVEEFRGPDSWTGWLKGRRKR
ncbi:hypothetical protein [Actinomyces minihominis]|uniref:hypothetical protein n=1 Tax=Actinomyces minihominis TaxID=2002838 RepID=UPI001F5D6761|nr:hypothetical protein [Actinomyces minihominis]